MCVCVCIYIFIEREKETRSTSPLENFFHDSFWFRVQGLGFELGVWG